MKTYVLVAAAVLVLLIGLKAVSNSDSNTYTGHDFFDLYCSGPTTCSKTANTYVVNVDGLWIEPNKHFVETCLEQKKRNEVTNSYCFRMYSPGDEETFTAPANLIKHIKRYGWNPNDPDVDRRLEAAERKLYGQSL
jgi:hypothetical protein